MDSLSKARKLVLDLLEPGAPNPGTFRKILFMGIRDAYEHHRDLLMEGKPADKTGLLKEYYREAGRFWRLHDRERAIYYLGGALYHLQDAWLGLSEDPSYEEYLERTLEWRKDLAPPKMPLKHQGTPESWVREAEEERRKLDHLVKQAVSLEELVQGTPHLDQITPHLARRAQAAGAALLLQFFVEAEETA